MDTVTVTGLAEGADKVTVNVAAGAAFFAAFLHAHAVDAQRRQCRRNDDVVIGDGALALRVGQRRAARAR